MAPKVKCKGHFEKKDKARCYSADCSPSSSDTIATNRIREGLEFSSLSRARRRKMMKIMLSQLAPWTQFELPNLEKWEPKRLFKTNFPNIQVMNDGEVNLFESLVQAQLLVSHGDHKESTEELRRHFSLFFLTTAWHELSAKRWVEREMIPGKSSHSYIG